MREESGVAAVILAAGSSSRMGAAKQLLPLRGRPLLQHVLDNVRQSSVREIVLVLGHSAETVQQAVNLDGARIVVNEQFQQGMGTSLKAGLSEVSSRSQAALIVLGDQPFVGAPTMDRLIGVHRESRGQIIIPTFRGFRGNPVLLDRAVFPELKGLSGDVGCRSIFGAHTEEIVRVAVDDVGILLDMDRPEDLRVAHGDIERLGQLPAVEISDPQEPSSVPADMKSGELVIVGRDVVAIAAAELGRTLGFTVTMVDPLLPVSDVSADRVLHALDFSLLEVNSDRHVIVASRGACDEEAIEQALQVKSMYVGLLGNKNRGKEVLRSLQSRGIAEADLARVRVPAGLNIHAETPQEIALSILAEIVSERRLRLVGRDSTSNSSSAHAEKGGKAIWGIRGSE